MLFLHAETTDLCELVNIGIIQRFKSTLQKSWNNVIAVQFSNPQRNSKFFAKINDKELQDKYAEIIIT